MSDGLIFGLFGLIIGSFLNVVIVRHGTKTLGGRSACMSCGAPIFWYDNVPIVSWLVLRGRCRACGSSISIQYPLVEALTGTLFALVGAVPSALAFRILALPILSLLIAIAVYDIRHTIIPDLWAYSFAVLALLSQFMFPYPESPSTLLVLLAGPVAALPLFVLWLVSRGRWMGLGDAKLALGIGWLLGPLWGIYAVFFSFVIGAVVSVAILLPLPYLMAAVRKTGIARFRGAGARFTMKSEVPFGPFLIASCIFVWFSLLFNIALPL
jgi:leader peptidase (prepilin peptidase)/N-methyltransferase